MIIGQTVVYPTLNSETSHEVVCGIDFFHRQRLTIVTPGVSAGISVQAHVEATLTKGQKFVTRDITDLLQCDGYQFLFVGLYDCNLIAIPLDGTAQDAQVAFAQRSLVARTLRWRSQ